MAAIPASSNRVRTDQEGSVTHQLPLSSPSMDDIDPMFEEVESDPDDEMERMLEEEEL